jgi:hypothetical protein
MSNEHPLLQAEFVIARPKKASPTKRASRPLALFRELKMPWESLSTASRPDPVE